MALQITSLNSGSNGNCYYVGNDDDAVLIDAGLSCRETERRMQNLGLSMNKVKAIFISHEHTDHIKGLESLSQKYRLPVSITGNTCRNIKLKQELVQSFNPFEPVAVGSLSITAFPKFHDAVDPHSFVVSCGGINIGVFTDIGKPCDQLVKYFSQCHAAFLEANYDESLLENGRYPVFLKNRIRGGHGHLSNAQALEVFVRHRPSYMSHLFLAHLSRDNNSPELVHSLFNKHAAGTNIIIASRYASTPVYTITEKTPIGLSVQSKPANRSLQLSMFS